MQSMRPNNFASKAERTTSVRNANRAGDTAPPAKPKLADAWPHAWRLIRPRRKLLGLGFVLMIINGGAGALGQFSVHQIPSFIGIALIPGLLAMLLYYRALSTTPASMASIAELAYPCTLFLVFSLPAPVGLGFPFYGIEIVGAIVLVAAVTTLNLLKDSNVVVAPPRVEPVLVHEGSA